MQIAFLPGQFEWILQGNDSLTRRERVWGAGLWTNSAIVEWNKSIESMTTPALIPRPDGSMGSWRIDDEGNTNSLNLNSKAEGGRMATTPLQLGSWRGAIARSRPEREMVKLGESRRVIAKRRRRREMSSGDNSWRSTIRTGWEIAGVGGGGDGGGGKKVFERRLRQRSTLSRLSFLPGRR